MAECAQLEADLEATQREAVRLALVSSCSQLGLQLNIRMETVL